MGTVADGNKVYNNNPSPSAEEGLLMLRENQEAFKETFGVMPPEVLVIKDDTISPTTAICNVRAEGGASADDITTITPTLSNGTTLHDGMVLLLSAKDASQRITLKNSAGQNGIVTTDGKDIVLSTKWYVILQFVENKWNQVSIGAPLPVSSSTVLGGVKVQTGDDDGLEMIGDKLRVRQANSTQRGTVLASEMAKAGAVPLGGADGVIDKGWIPEILFNSRVVITESDASWNPPVIGWARVTIIGGGGGGGKGGGYAVGGSGGNQGGSTSFGNLTAAGGSGGGGGNASAGGGGGESGEIKTEFIRLNASPIKIVIGAGGAGGSVTQSGFPGTAGKGPHGGGVCSIGTQGGGGAPGAGNGNCHEAENASTRSPGVGGSGAVTKTGYGGGGGGGAGGLELSHTTSGGAATDSATSGYSSSSNDGGNGGAGGQGAVILEYYDPNKEAV